MFTPDALRCSTACCVVFAACRKTPHRNASQRNASDVNEPLVTGVAVSRKAVRAAPKLNILLGPDEASIQDSSVDEQHYSYHRAVGGSRLYSESTLTESTDICRSVPSVHGPSTNSRYRLAQRGDGGLYSDGSGRPSCVELRNCGCSLVSCTPPPPPPPATGSVTLARRCQEPANMLYTARRNPDEPAVDRRPKPSIYWQVAGRSDAPPFDKPQRGTSLAVDRHVTSGENDDVIGKNGAGDAENAGGSEPGSLSNPDRSPDLVLNGRHRDQHLTGSSSSACTSGQDDRRGNSSSGRKRFNNQETLD